ncbi:MAG: peptide deformylase [Leptolyngbyaceae cyanobacterium SL_7_1]|nr:peptide deformylase [Leptolyngbyaceae cyanobacterium SL_7_1]
MVNAFPIAQLGEPVLRQPATLIEDSQAPWVQSLIDRLLVTLHQSNGVGIAAPQVAQSHRLFVVASRPNPRYPNAPLMNPTAMLNPRLISHTEDTVRDWEGCLSIPGIRGLVPRYSAIEVEYQTREGELHQQILEGFVARIFQHELDHLNGVVFLDRLESVQDIITDQVYLQRLQTPTPQAQKSIGS